MRVLLAAVLLVSCGSASSAPSSTIPDTVALIPSRLPATSAAIVVELPTTTTTEAPTTTSSAPLAPAVAVDPAVRLHPPTPTTPPPVWVRFDCESFRPLFVEAGLPFEYFGTVVMPRESHCDPDAFYRASRDWSFGLLQINTLGALWGELQWRCDLTSREQLFDPLTNLRCARAMFDAYGYRPWRT